MVLPTEYNRRERAGTRRHVDFVALTAALVSTNDYDQAKDEVKNPGDYDLRVLAASLGGDFRRNPSYLGAEITRLLRVP